MTVEFDEKGKYYTNVVQKVPVPSVIQTTTNLIRGQVHVRQDERLKDELENKERFIAVTDASVTDASGGVVFTGPFLAVLKDQIVWIMPLGGGQAGEEAS